MESKKTKSVGKELREKELFDLFSKADEIKQETFDFDEKGFLETRNELQELFLKPIDNPKEKYDLYYNMINKLLKNSLPKGYSYKKARDLIYEEKNTFLTGKRKGKDGKRYADGRMSYSPIMHELINLIIDWKENNGTILELYLKIRDKNIELGYGSPEL